jgi:putative cardiolipin synthase
MTSRALICINGLFFLLVLAGCAAGPIDYPRNYSEAIPGAVDTRLGQEVEEWEADHPDKLGKSGYYPLVLGTDAFGARLALADIAERSIDAQYFLMKKDSAGLIFSDRLLKAADRGVRVRFLLDDVFTSVKDSDLGMLDQHPNIEVRIFNPIGRRGFYYLNYLADFKRANRRMHNKSFTVDGHVSIVGGRNIADEYFELKTDAEFRDFDMLAMGPITDQVSAKFDLFWNHELSVPVRALVDEDDLRDLNEARANFDAKARAEAIAIYERAIGSRLVRDLADDKVRMYIADAEMITDDPEKLLNEVSREHQVLVTALAEMVANAEFEVVVVTPYFIPGKNGVEFWRSLVDKGVRVIILTNSLASNNHIPVHAAYARYRHDMIQAGVELYELKVDATDQPGNPNEEQFESVTLHTKAVAIDRRILTVGSLNLDPRSIDINTESALVIDSGPLTERLVEPALERLKVTAYRVTENDKGKLRWTTTVDGVEVVEKGEPQAGSWRRFKAFLSRILPESQL